MNLTFPEAAIRLRFQIRIFELKVMEHLLSARKYEKIIRSCRLWSALAFFCGVIALKMVLNISRCFFYFYWFFKMNHFTVSHILPKLLCLWIRIWNYKCFQSSLFSYSPVEIFFICSAYFDFSCWCKLLFYYLRKKIILDHK